MSRVRTRPLALLALFWLGAAALLLSGCSAAVAESSVATAEAAGEGTHKRAYGTPDPCQRTVMTLRANAGVDLNQAGGKLVDAYEGYQGIADVVLDANTGTLTVTWCNSMQNEEGLKRAINLTGLVSIEQLQTSAK